MRKKRTSRLYEYKRSLTHHVLPITVWLCTVICVIGLFYNRTQHIEVLGIVQGESYEVAATNTGRIVNILVEPYQSVQKDQTVAIINIVPDSAPREQQLQSQLETVSAHIKYLAAQLIPTQEKLSSEASRLETTHVGDVRRFSVDVENIQLRILELRAQIESDRLLLKTMELDIDTTRQLVAKDAIAPYELEKAQYQHDALQRSIEDNQQLLAQAQNNLLLAQERRDQFLQQQIMVPSVENALEVIRKQIEEEECRMNEITTQLRGLQEQQAIALKAPFAGIVNHVYASVGEVADVNVPLLNIVEAHPSRVIAYADQEQSGQIKENMMVEVVTDGTPQTIARCRITAVGPLVEQVPMQLWRHPSIPQWGRPFIVDLPKDMDLLVGQKVGIRRIGRAL